MRVSASAPENWKERHQLIFETILAFPQFKQKDLILYLAKEYQLEVSQGWLSILIGSDMFQTKLEEARRVREAALHQRHIELKEKLYTTTGIVIDRLGHTARAATSLEELTEAAETLLPSVGFGPKLLPSSGQQNVQVNLQVNGGEDSAFQRARALAQRKPVDPIEHLFLDEEISSEQVPNALEFESAAGRTYNGESEL
jgi:hypothetical protein